MAVTTKLTQEDYAAVKQLAQKAGVGISTVMRELVRVGLGHAEDPRNS